MKTRFHLIAYLSGLIKNCNILRNNSFDYKENIVIIVLFDTSLRSGDKLTLELESYFSQVSNIIL